MIVLCSCQPALINLPKVDCPEPIIRECPKVTCPVLDLPERVPDNVIVELKGGRVVRVNQDGETLLRNYIGTRKAIVETRKGLEENK